jgi:hypothetical protein
MSAAQAALIVTMRAAVDKRLDDMGHTCTQPVPNPNLRCVFVLHFIQSYISHSRFKISLRMSK